LSSGSILRVIAAAAARALVSTALPLPLVGKSRMCPTLDFTMKSLPRYLFIVLALAGDSTITNDLLIYWYLNPFAGCLEGTYIRGECEWVKFSVEIN